MALGRPEPSKVPFHTTFPTTFGQCALAWRDAALVGTALPGIDDAATILAAIRTCPDAVAAPPPAWVADLVARIQSLLAGEPIHFTDVPLSLDRANPFEREVYRAASAIPHGDTRTYGELATEIGRPGAARAIGRALGRNPVPIVIPCHRILAADGRTGGFSAPGGVSTKMRLLQVERSRGGAQASLFDLSWDAAPIRA
jgi:methylated-DNA-[protein]-cysteine S-methyltransferase